MLAIGEAEQHTAISLYFHIPFCSRKCPYCHFYVVSDKDSSKEKLLIALELHWKQVQPLLQNKKIVSIYFGGGTPSLFGAEPIATILRWIDPPSSTEITLETNPENSTYEKLRAYRAARINRLSIGVQSLDDSLLKTLGRTHNALEALQAAQNGNRAGFENISIDLMYDLPGQTLLSWEETLRAATALPITHLSLYNLTIEPYTSFFSKKEKLIPLLPSPEASLQMLETAVSHLENHGLRRYEISAFAKNGFSSLHNTGYWTARPFLGLGPSAFSYWDHKRFRMVQNLKHYLERLQKGLSPIDFEEKLPPPDRLHELLAVELRLLRGVHIPSFQKKHTPLPFSTLDTLDMLQKEGLLCFSEDTFRLTPKGLLFYDSVASAII